MSRRCSPGPRLRKEGGEGGGRWRESGVTRGERSRAWENVDGGEPIEKGRPDVGEEDGDLLE